MTSALDQLDNKAFTASTASNDDGHAPHKARQNDGWKPKAHDSNPWLQIDMGEPVTIAGIVTKGSTTATGWVTEYRVQISQDCKTFIDMQTPTGKPEVLLRRTKKEF